MGGGATINSALAAGLVDTLTLHLPARHPGHRDAAVHRRSAALAQHSVTSTSTVTHLSYDVL